MTGDKLRALFKECGDKVKAWSVCPGHELEKVGPVLVLGQRYQCRVCGGECNSITKAAYEQGLRHGGRTVKHTCSPARGSLRCRACKRPAGK